ncbi:hypothetical protein PENTCL1PPCAC_2475 [Pristionchus entomophagus]|uniref:C2H2-type domain-containing protein n=1 Tax=Pristionchus entomophagus TaxID=358040 RepID=A0AAV5SBR7_9BILA|nr:hypothetical protein PENTCL1PPCAC_2475 [Pristionchus entomophagus]
MKNFSTTSNMVAHLRSRHPGIFPPIIKRRRMGHFVRPQVSHPSQHIDILYEDEDVKPIVDIPPSGNSNNLEMTKTIVAHTQIVNRLDSPDNTENQSMNGITHGTPSTPISTQHHQSNTSNGMIPIHSHLPSSSRSIPRLSSPPAFSYPSSSSLPLPSTPELEQLHARLLRAQIEREEAVARYYNALANRANTETSMLREK